MGIAGSGGREREGVSAPLAMVNGGLPGYVVRLSEAADRWREMSWLGTSQMAGRGTCRPGQEDEVVGSLRIQVQELVEAREDGDDGVISKGCVSLRGVGMDGMGSWRREDKRGPEGGDDGRSRRAWGSEVLEVLRIVSRMWEGDP